MALKASPRMGYLAFLWQGPWGRRSGLFPYLAWSGVGLANLAVYGTNDLLAHHGMRLGKYLTSQFHRHGGCITNSAILTVEEERHHAAHPRLFACCRSHSRWSKCHAWRDNSSLFELVMILWVGEDMVPSFREEQQWWFHHVFVLVIFLPMKNTTRLECHSGDRPPGPHVPFYSGLRALDLVLYYLHSFLLVTD
jgi:hypothetical protein